MKRRLFLRGLLGASAAVVAAPVIAKLLPVDNSNAILNTPDRKWFKLDVTPLGEAEVISDDSFARAMMPGIEKWYGKEYYNAKAKGIPEIFKK